MYKFTKIYKITPLPLRGEIGQLCKKKRVLCVSVLLVNGGAEGGGGGGSIIFLEFTFRIMKCYNNICFVHLSTEMKTVASVLNWVSPSGLRV